MCIFRRLLSDSILRIERRSWQLEFPQLVPPNEIEIHGERQGLHGWFSGLLLLGNNIFVSMGTRKHPASRLTILALNTDRALGSVICTTRPRRAVHGARVAHKQRHTATIH